MPRSRGRRRFVVLAGASLLLAGMLSGCWSRREINELAVVLALGVDRLPGGRGVEVTAEVARPSQLGKNPETGGGGEPATWVVSARGATLFEAIRQLGAVTPRRPFWAHNQAVIFGEGAARSGVGRELDLLRRDYEFRRTARIYVARGEARQVLRTPPHVEKSLGQELEGFARFRSSRSETPVVTLNDFFYALSEPGRDPVAGLLWAEQRTAGQGPRPDLVVNGAALFRGDRLVRWLTPHETRGLLWVIGEVDGGALAAPCPGDGSRRFALDIIRGRPQVNLRHNRVHLAAVDVRIDVDATLVETACRGSAQDSPTALAKAAAAPIRHEVEAALAAAQAVRADPFGLGEVVRREQPAIWRTLRSQWGDAFAHLNVSVSVHVVIRATGLQSAGGRG
ncbi:MAG: Ger(x)C family spore germination protein [Clostridia bacterium]|nr:Ger(x)C family spore germination protein [Clostridia bacterium]